MNIHLSSATAIAHRERIIEAASELMHDGGRDAVSTRAVSALAGVQAPTIYRIFGDMTALLDVVAHRGYELQVEKRGGLPRTGDPVADIRRGWDVHVDLGLANPDLYYLIYADAREGQERPALATLTAGLQTAVHRIAEYGRLRMSEERAAHLVHAANRGLILTLLTLPVEHRDLTLSTLAREAAIVAITNDSPHAPTAGPVGAAVALRAVLPQISSLTATEIDLLREWLDRIALAPN